MKTIIITGCGGLIGSESVEFFLKNYNVVGIDNNMRQYFFGAPASVIGEIEKFTDYNNFTYYNTDIRNYSNLEDIFKKYEGDIHSIIHTAAQPSHDWAVSEPLTDYMVNSTGTLNLLELTRKYAVDSSFIYVSTSKVYGDNPNKLEIKEFETRYDLDKEHHLYNGINETFSIDSTTHSLFGCSKLSADIYVQEYGKYFGMKTVIFRPGCLTGSKHKGVELHGFLNYIVRCNITNMNYNVFGYNGKQVRCNINSYDLVLAFNEYLKNPNCGEVYNIGGGRNSNCSLIEAVDIVENITGIKMKLNFKETPRIGDHIWWISDTNKFVKDFPNWKINYTIEDIIKEIINGID
jgi:CDP-paratose 2-epimerase